MEQALHSNPIPQAGTAAVQPAWTSAIERHRSGDTEGAIVLYQRHLKRNPQDAPGWMNLGAALRRTGRADAALVASQRVSPSRLSEIQSPFGTRTPEVVPFQVNRTSLA